MASVYRASIHILPKRGAFVILCRCLVDRDVRPVERGGGVGGRLWRSPRGCVSGVSCLYQVAYCVDQVESHHPNVR